MLMVETHKDLEFPGHAEEGDKEDLLNEGEQEDLDLPGHGKGRGA